MENLDFHGDLCKSKSACYVDYSQLNALRMKFVYGVCIVFSKPHDTMVLAVEAIVVQKSNNTQESSWFRRQYDER